MTDLGLPTSPREQGSWLQAPMVVTTSLPKRLVGWTVLLTGSREHSCGPCRRRGSSQPSGPISSRIWPRPQPCSQRPRPIPAHLPPPRPHTALSKFSNWTNGAFLAQGSLLNVRSFLGVGAPHGPHLSAPPPPQPPVPVAAGVLHGDKASARSSPSLPGMAPRGIRPAPGQESGNQASLGRRGALAGEGAGARGALTQGWGGGGDQWPSGGGRGEHRGGGEGDV